MSGEEPIISYEDAKKQFKDKVNYIIKGDEPFLNEPSTIVKVEDNKIKVLRKGPIKFN